MHQQDQPQLAADAALATLRDADSGSMDDETLRGLVDAASEFTFSTELGPEGVLLWQLYEGEQFEAETLREALIGATTYLVREMGG